VDFFKQFLIPFSNLKVGTYPFEFEINNSFFDYFETSEIKNGRLNVSINFEKQSRMLILIFKISGNVRLICDRCLDEFDQNIQTEKKLIVKLGTEEKEETDEIISIPNSEHAINVAQYIYEFIHLALPTKRVHPTKENGESLCNAEVLKKLKEHQINIVEEIDPRWESLKNIKLN